MISEKKRGGGPFVDFIEVRCDRNNQGVNGHIGSTMNEAFSFNKIASFCAGQARTLTRYAPPGVKLGEQTVLFAKCEWSTLKSVRRGFTKRENALSTLRIEQRVGV